MTLATMSNNLLRFAPGLNPDLIKSNIQDSYKMLMSKEWNRLNLIRSIPTIIPYSTGTVSIATDGVVTGVSTVFTSAMVGRFMRVYYDDCLFEVQTYTSATSVTLRNWTGEALPAGTSCTAEADDETFTSAAHGLSNGDRVYILATTLPTGLSSAIQYYVVAATTNTFQVSLTSGGGAVTFTTDGTAVRWTQTLETYSIFPLIYSVDSTFGMVYEVAYQTSLTKKSQTSFNKLDPSRTMTGSTPIYWAYAGVTSTGTLQIEIYPVVTSVVSLRIYGKLKYSTLADGDSLYLPEDLIESHALISCYRQKAIQNKDEGWGDKLQEATTFYSERLETYQEEDYQLDSHPEKVKDTLFGSNLPYSTDFAVDHDLENY